MDGRAVVDNNYVNVLGQHAGSMQERNWLCGRPTNATQASCDSLHDEGPWMHSKCFRHEELVVSISQ